MKIINITGTKREVIIEAAIKKFAEGGYYETGISDIKEQADVSVGSIYHHFKSKEELFITCVKVVYDDFVAQMIKKVKGKENKLYLLINFFLDFFKKNTSHTRLLIVESHTFSVSNPELKIWKLHNDFEDLLYDLIKDDLTQDYPQTFITMLLGGIEHFIRHWVYYPESLDIKTKDELVKKICKSLKVNCRV